ncbi:hypothetical protein OROMI_025219 [Orobanche minor]
MDGSNLYNLSNSVRNSTSIRERTGSLWRSSGMEVFSKSVRDGDDEEALKWASLEKLLTFDRLRKGLLLRSKGVGASEIDIDNLGTEERKKILQRLVNVAEKDNDFFFVKT